MVGGKQEIMVGHRALKKMEKEVEECRKSSRSSERLGRNCDMRDDLNHQTLNRDKVSAKTFSTTVVNGGFHVSRVTKVTCNVDSMNMSNSFH